jgi:hypothetical protein
MIRHPAFLSISLCAFILAGIALFLVWMPPIPQDLADLSSRAAPQIYLDNIPDGLISEPKLSSAVQTKLNASTGSQFHTLTALSSIDNADELHVYNVSSSDYYKITMANLASGISGSGEANTISSAGTGASLAYQKDGVDLQLNAIKSENDRLSVSLDSGTHDVELTINEANIDHDALTNFSASEHFTQASITTVGTVASGDVSAIESDPGVTTHESTYNHANYNTAYGWGNHAIQNYLDLDTYPNTDTNSIDDLTTNTSWGGDLSGIGASPSVSNDSHNHTTTTISGLDISDDTNLAGGTSLTLSDDTLNVDDDFVHNSGGDIMAPTLTISDSATTSPLNLTERSTTPSLPSIGDVYLDDGTNCVGDGPCLRRYTGAGWEDVDNVGGVGSGEANTASNQGTGTSLYYTKSGVDLQFNAIKSENDRLSISLDSGTHDVELTINEANIDHDALTNFSASEHFTQASITTVGTVTSGDISAIESDPGVTTHESTYNHTNYNTAYGWGNHALQNYLDLDTYPNADMDSTDDVTVSTDLSDTANLLYESELDSENELETQIGVGVFTTSDGALSDDDVSLVDVQTALSNDFHNAGGTDDDIPESGDFGAATNLDNNGSLSISNETQGDVLYFNGSNWIRLAKGTAGQVLEMNATATAPEWDTDDGAGSASIENDVYSSGWNGDTTNGASQNAIYDYLHQLDTDDDGDVDSVDSSVSGGASFWTAESTFARSDDDTITITVDDCTNYQAGTPIRYSADESTWYYGVTVACSDIGATINVDLDGVAFSTSYDDYLQYGDSSRMRAKNIVMPGNCTVADPFSLVLYHQENTAYLVRATGIAQDTAPAGSALEFNVEVEDTDAFSSEISISAGSSSQFDSGVTVNTSNYDVEFGETIHVSTSQCGSSTPGQTLSVTLSFIYP